MSFTSFGAIKSLLSAETLKDIEGLDEEEFGFNRAECSGCTIPPKLRGSMRLREHVFLLSSMPHTEWAPKLENVPPFSQLSHLIKHSSTHERKDDGVTCNLAYLPGGAASEEYILRVHERENGSVNDDHNAGMVKTTSSRGTFELTQYALTGGDGYHLETAKTLPWVANAAESDRSSEYFIFVCAHLTRDKRCGFCGMVLVDLLSRCVREEVAKREKDAAPSTVLPKISVLPCSHVGGHIYAGNVLVYSRYGGVAFGLFRPDDVQALITALLEDKGDVPSTLVERVRGHVGAAYDHLQ